MKTIPLFQKISLALCLAVFLLVFVRGFSTYRSMVRIALEQSSLSGAIAAMEARIAERLPARLSVLIDIYGLFHRLLGKNEVGGFYVVRDRAGMLQFGTRGSPALQQDPLDFQYDGESVGQLPAFSAFCKENNIPFICIPTPPRALDAYLPPGVTSAEQTNRRKTVRILESLGINVFDPLGGRDATAAEQLELFFRTDHHWTIETAFRWHAGFLDYLRAEHGFVFPDHGRNTDLRNYSVEVFPNRFLGSAGQRVGRYYAEWDDYSLITPSFETAMTCSIDSGETVAGSFDAALIHRRHLRQGIRPPNCYTAYLDGDHGETVIRNEKGKHRILIVQNSFGLPFSSFLSLSFAETAILDLRHYREMSVAEYMRKHPGFDVVLCMDLFFHAGFMP